MHRRACLWIPLLALALLCSAVSVPTLGACRLLPPGGENGGGLGIWILPRSLSFSSPDLALSDSRIYDRNGLDIEVPDSSQRVGDDLHVVLGGSVVVVAAAFFDADLDQGSYYDVVTGQTKVWLRD
jgi:hypothetical protein